MTRRARRSRSAIAGRGDVGARRCARCSAIRTSTRSPPRRSRAQGDRAARPVLEHQLGSSPLRVLAARALRRLDPELDPQSLLPPLVDVVRRGRDIERIPAAEAILLLAGPASWSAFD